MTSRLPGTLWIELTSKCPLDCVFCSRKLLRGNGQHMEFALFKSIVSQLESPEIIRLNYSGESIHYPRLMEAIQLAAGTGAWTELVSAFVSLPQEQIEALVRSRLDRLTVSLHTLDEREFGRIYGYGTVRQMREKLLALRRCQRETGIDTPKLDFAFVAMQRNLAQLRAVAEFGREMGVSEISVHPVIRRDEIAEPFDVELDNGQFRPAFRRGLISAVAEIRETIPGITVELSTPEMEDNPQVGSRPQYYWGPLPSRARIFSCDQNPWETAHILANGDVVSCELRDRLVMGNLRDSSLAEIWHGRPYREFRECYQLGRISPCHTCAYKKVYIPGPLEGRISPGTGDAQLFRGWYSPEATVCWSKQRSSALLFATAKTDQLRIRGVLPSGPGGNNELAIHCDGKPIGSVRNTTPELQNFETVFNISRGARHLRVDFAVQHICRPLLAGSSDVRQLGFALAAMSVSEGRSQPIRRASFMPLRLAIQASQALAPVLSAFPARRAKRLSTNSGVSIVVPERATPDLLADCIASALAAARKLGEPAEIIVVVNGAPLQSYAGLQNKYPAVRWLHSVEALGFQKAIIRGLEAARFDWVYLLNSDMVLDPAALVEVGRWRGLDVFAIASQIFFTDTGRRREETGWTGALADGSRVSIFDLTPEDPELVRTHLYAGGGSSLFHRDLLLKLLDATDPYGPFYWEDVEWGFRALTAGYQVLFCPRSRAYHVHRATVGQFYTNAEIERIFFRNSWLFALRNGFRAERPRSLIAEVKSMDSTTQKELSKVSTAASIARSLVNSAKCPSLSPHLETINNGFLLKPFSPLGARPRLLIVTPYSICPAAHGGARRIRALVEELGKSFDIIVVSDEGALYQQAKLRHLQGVTAIHLVNGRREDGETQDRIRRIQSHSHQVLKMEVSRLIRQYAVDIVQVEYAELAGLAQTRANGVPWFITLHDVLFSQAGNSREDLFEADLLARFSGIMACTEEDAKLVPRCGATVVPNGARMPARPYRPSRGNQTILFAGPFRYRPNLEGIVNFLEDVYPSLLKTFPSLTVDVLGGDEGVAIAKTMSCFGQPGVRVRPFIEDLQTSWEGCVLSINPLYNTRGSSLKLIESIAHGRICVSTKQGAIGFTGDNLPGLVQVDRVEDFEGAIRWLLTDVDERLRRESPPPNLAARFSWEYSAARQAALYRQYLK